MMLSKSSDEVESSAAQKPKPLDAQKKAQEVADLERRLKDLSTTTVTPSTTGRSTSSTTPTQVALSAAARPAAIAATATNSVGGGKNALLARIMAAQERAKNQQQAHGLAPVVEATTAPPAFARPPPPLESSTFASMSSPPPPPAFASPPPPAFASPPTMFAPPPPPDYFAAPPPPAPPTMFMAPPLHTSADTLTAPPPSFDFLDSVGIGPHPPTFDAMSLPPKQEAPPPAFLSGFSAPEAPSAPSFDLLMMDPAPVPPAMPPPAMPPPQSASSSTGLDDEAMQVILAMEGMSDADKQQLIQEQLNIMKSIENTKRKGSNAQISAADAFEQRSFSANVQAAGSRTTIHGPERTRRALADGATVVTVQCAACDTLLQVTGAAQFMFCPTCQTVTPVVADNQDATDRAQLEADMKLAQELQKEEYESADRQEQRRATATTATAKPPSANGTTSWMEWLGLSSTPTPAAAARSEEDVVSFERSGQTAEKAPLFACVTDSISSAANYALNLPQDEEGNVHGVDSTSLLAVPQVGRNTTKSPPS